MKPTYEMITNELGGQFIKATHEDGVIMLIPTDPANSDYQRYLESLNDDTETE
jgi:hypothetical protein